MKNFIVYLLLVIMVGCASNADRAKDHMEKENWEKAHAYWVLALVDDPSDEEAVEGKRRAEYEITNKKLVQLRNLLGAGKSQQAVDLAWDLEKLHRKWGYTDSHAIGAFHGKQLKRLYPHFIKLLKTPTYTDFPVKSLILIKRFEPIFAKMNQEYIKDMKDKTMGRGKTLCNELRGAKKNKSPFYNDISERVCSIFYKTSSVPEVRNKFLERLSTDTRTNIYVGGLSRDYNQTLKSYLSEEFGKSPLIHSQGKKILKVSVKGAVGRSETSRVERRVAEYQKEVKYRERQKTYENGKEVYKLVTKKKNVTKYFNYNVVVTKRIYKINLGVRFKALGRIQYVPVVKKLEEEIENHNYNASYAGVSPVSQEFQPEAIVIDRVLKETADAARKKASNAWKQKYCNGDLPAGMNRATEMVMKCRLAKDGSQKNYQNWMNKYFGLTKVDDRQDFEILLGFENA